jgi:membrane fusion protein (multidrug efflux system)
MKNKRFFSAFCIVILTVTGCNSKKKEQTEVPAQSYPVAIMTMQTAELETVYPAVIKGQEDIEIRPRVDGFIDAIYVDEGSFVKKGEILFKINSPSSEQLFATEKAAVNSAKAQLNTAEVDVNRMRPLAEKGIISPVQLKAYENTYQSAKASLQQAQAALENARATLSWTTVTSPVDGVVGTIPYRKGSLVSNANLLTTVSNIKNVYAYFSLNEKELMSFLNDTEGENQVEKIKNLPPVTLMLADGSVYPQKGEVETIAGIVDATTGSVNFRAKFSNEQGILRSGASANVSIPEKIDSVFIIPQKATFEQQDKVLVYKVKNNTAKQAVIAVKAMPDGKNYAVTHGISLGDTIITDGVATLRDGKKINIEK